MNMSKETYKRYAEAHAPRSPILKNCANAFWIGGGICVIGQALRDVCQKACHMSMEDAGTLTSVTLVLCAVLLTGFGFFDCIAKIAGAGTLVPITGFANAVASPAIDDKSEGLVMGVGAQMFTIAGPVIVYGILTSVLYGFCYWLWGVLM